MAEEGNPQRSYSSALRDQQQELTRSRITEAVVELVREGRLHSFSVQEVAERAGVSYGSVYRHFPTREALLEGVYEIRGRSVGRSAILPPRTLEEIPAWAESVARFSEEHSDDTQAAVMALIALGIRPKSMRATDELCRELVAEAAPDLDPAEIRYKAAIIRYLASSLAWVTLKQRFGLNAKEIPAAMTWALSTLIREIRRDRQAGSEKGKVT